MGAILFIILVGVPIVEIALFIEIGGLIGFWSTIGVVVLTALAGTTLLRYQGLATLRKAQASLEQNRFPIDEVFDGLCLAVAGALLLTPGFFTDGIGLLLFLPPLRKFLRHRIARMMAERGHVEVHATGPNGEAGPVIDGEFEDITPGEDRPPERLDIKPGDKED
ncbi:MAG TPA: FxsA family protein [Rhodospirillales bacterium]|jgi:UPF0716 protein FxsA|nr:FxsA family protein [Rhodospirillales bacterium]